jgi:hypothetical protein
VPLRGAGWEPDSSESELNNLFLVQRSISNLYGGSIRFARVVLLLLWTIRNFHRRHRAHFFLYSTTTNCLFPAQTATRDLLLQEIRSYPIVRSLFYPLDSMRPTREMRAFRVPLVWHEIRMFLAPRPPNQLRNTASYGLSLTILFYIQRKSDEHSCTINRPRLGSTLIRHHLVRFSCLIR